MRIIKLSMSFIIAVLLMLGTIQNVFPSDNLSDVIKNGKTTITSKIWYQTNDNSKQDQNIFNKENSIFDTGVMLGYETNSYYGFAAGVKFYAVDDLGMHNKIACNCIHNTESGVPGTWLAEAHLSYKIRGTLAKIGRQGIKSPLVNSDGWAIVPNYFEALMINNTDIPATSLTAGYVTQERWLKGKKFEDIGNGIFLLGGANQSIPNSSLSAWFYHARNFRDGNDVNTVYLDAGTKVFMIGLNAQYMFFTSNSNDLKDTHAYGIKVSWTRKIFELSGAFTSVNKGSFNAAKFSDHGIKTPIYSATISGDGDIAGGIDTYSYKASAAANVIKGLKLAANYGYYDHGAGFTPSPNTESTSIEFITTYSGISNVTIFATYVLSDHNGVGAWAGATANDKLSTIRIWTQYSF